MDDVEIRQGTLPWTDRHDWMMPAADAGTIDWPFRFGTVDVDNSITAMAPYIEQWRTCIQAGGCVGFWPLRLKQYFERVITFEPEPVNYRCLLHNTDGADIEAHPFALGSDASALVQMGLEPRYVGHCGAWQVMPGGNIETRRIDDLGLDDVDLIYLDIEGSEYDALLGAAETISQCRPIIGLENTGLCRRYHGGASPVDWLKAEHGYQVLALINGKDIILHAPAP